MLCEVVLDDGTMARIPELAAFAARHGLPFISIADLIRYRWRNEKLVTRVADTPLPTEWGLFRCLAFESAVDDRTHLALTYGEVAGQEDVLVRVQSECLTGDVFASRKCDCGPQLHESMRRIAAAGRGAVVYLRGHEGRGIGIAHKLARTNSNSAASTPSTRTSSSAFPSTAATTASVPRSLSTSGSPACG